MSDWAPDVPQAVRSELPPFGIKPHWVTFGFSTPANRLYDLYNAHVDRSRGDLVVWPTLDDLAKMMGLSRGDKVTPYMRELESGGAVAVETVTKTGGKGRRYIITLLVHPPLGFAGPMQSSDWHEVKRANNPDKPTMSDRARGVHSEEPAGGEVPPPEGGYVGPLDGGDVHPVEGAVRKNHLNQNHNNQNTAPSARSAVDVRRTTTGSSGRALDSGSAATEQTSLFADDVEETRSSGEAGAEEPGKGAAVPGPRPASRKPSPYAPELRQRIYAVEALLPASLRAALAVKLPHGHLPNVTRQVIAQALETRTPEELGDRAARRWVAYGYERDHYDGLLRSPVGVVEELLRPTPYCPVATCEDGRDKVTGLPCSTCEVRIETRARDRAAGRKVPTQRPARLYRDREECDVCQRPLPRQGAADGLCPRCRTDMDQVLAGVRDWNTPPAADPAPAAEHDTPGPAAAPSYGRPNAEYRAWRDNRTSTLPDAIARARADKAARQEGQQ
ncbi:hypothetical protein ACKI16_29740 [Streptomyces scabiei]|uniref:hypothetical protein n=1 Tax=Streptomyces scabiei TaxID=1930 RepID=UPI0038F77B5F